MILKNCVALPPHPNYTIQSEIFTSKIGEMYACSNWVCSGQLDTVLAVGRVESGDKHEWPREGREWGKSNGIYRGKLERTLRGKALGVSKFHHSTIVLAKKILPSRFIALLKSQDDVFCLFVIY